MKLYYTINDETFINNSLKKNNFKTEYFLYSDKNLSKKVGTIIFNSDNLENQNNLLAIKQSCYVTIILNDNTNVMYNYVRNGLDKIKTKPTYSNSNIKNIKRYYITNNLRKLCLI